ncbi:ribulose-phosphate 3-epimerase [Enterococcus faecium]|uniref:ribulose-phosphate 3-epimerase n=1 Tax=Enterococcus faecium TaxID=1352 RepID=UPI00110733E0|nr:ribulose-phosphate 3-epimerase [Enterococcus faecium]
MKIAPSILNIDLSKLKEVIRQVELVGIDYLHVDIMDGHFVPNLSFGTNIVSNLKELTSTPLDCHLMVQDPERWVSSFAEAGADQITVHVESTPHIHRTIQMIKQSGLKAGVVINPGTSIDAIQDVLEIVDIVLVMSVNPGFGMQKFLPSTIRKISLLSELRDRLGLNFAIEVDGGVNEENAAELKKAGCDILVAGSYIFEGDDIATRVNSLKG